MKQNDYIGFIPGSKNTSGKSLIRFSPYQEISQCGLQPNRQKKCTCFPRDVHKNYITSAALHELKAHGE